jgi:hypothetical protein
VSIEKEKLLREFQDAVDRLIQGATSMEAMELLVEAARIIDVEIDAASDAHEYD